MLPVTFPEQNFEFHKPSDMTDEQCMSLPVWKEQARIDDDGGLAQIIISCWQLSKEDLEEINHTGRIWLSVTGSGLPPVSLFTENPFTNDPG